MRDGLVYYALDATRTDLHLKIGYTTDLRSRMIDLQWWTASGQIPTLLAVEAGGRPLERQRHEEFNDLRVQGEWFRYTGRLIAHVAGLEDPFDYLKQRPELLRYANGWRSLRTPPQPIPPSSLSSDLPVDF